MTSNLYTVQQHACIHTECGHADDVLRFLKGGGGGGGGAIIPVAVKGGRLVPRHHRSSNKLPEIHCTVYA